MTSNLGIDVLLNGCALPAHSVSAPPILFSLAQKERAAPGARKRRFGLSSGSGEAACSKYGGRSKKALKKSQSVRWARAEVPCLRRLSATRTGIAGSGKSQRPLLFLPLPLKGSCFRATKGSASLYERYPLSAMDTKSPSATMIWSASATPTVARAALARSVAE